MTEDKMGLDSVERIQSAISAMELRSERAVTLLPNGGESCKVFFRRKVFSIPCALRPQVREGLAEVQPISNGFLGLAQDPERLRKLLEESAKLLDVREDDWNGWAREMGMAHLPYKDFLQILATNAVWFLRQS
jgi:hypothetical protein